MPNEMIKYCLSNNKNLGDRYSSHMTHSSVHETTTECKLEI